MRREDEEREGGERRWSVEWGREERMEREENVRLRGD